MQATIHGVTKSRARLSDFTLTFQRNIVGLGSSKCNPQAHRFPITIRDLKGTTAGAQEAGPRNLHFYRHRGIAYAETHR